MKREVAFRALNAARAAKSRANLRFLVKSVNKDGSVSRAPFTQLDWQLRAFTTAEEAEARRAELERLNPGSRFVVVPA